MKYHGWELNDFDSADNFRNYQFNLILKYIKGNVAEIGPGTGNNIKKYIHKTSSLHLYEPSIKLHKFLKKKLKNKKIKIFKKPMKLSKKKYNTIMYLDVLEHIENDKLEIKKSIKSLKKGGYLIINVPAFNILYSDFDRDVGHFRRYQKKDINKILKKEDLTNIKLLYFDSIGFLLSLFSKIFISNYKKNFSGKISIWNKLIPFSKILDKLCFNTIGKSLVCIIKK